MWFTETGFHIGVDEQSGLVAGMAANVADITQVGKLLHGQESTIGADAGYTGVEKRAEHAGRKVIWQIAARRGSIRSIRKTASCIKLYAILNMPKPGFAPRLNTPFRVIKRQFDYTKVRFRGLAKNTAQLITLFALANLWMVRRFLLANTGELHP